VVGKKSDGGVWSARKKNMAVGSLAVSRRKEEEGERR